MIEFIRKAFGTINREVKRSFQREISFYKSIPRVSTLVLTYRCTSQCKTCTAWKRPRANLKELELSDWKRIVEQLYDNNISDVEIFGGDVFLRKDILMPLIRFIKEKAMTIHLPTNANLLDQDTAKELVVSGVDFIYLSVDGVGGTQDKIRGIDGTFERVTKALKFLNLARGRRKTPIIICNTTVSNLNLNFLEDIADFAHKICFDEIHFEYVGEFSEEHIEQSIINGIKPTPFYIKQGDSVLLSKQDAEKLKNTLWKIRKRFANTNLYIQTVNIDTLPLKNIYQGTINNKKCYILRSEVDIDPYGNITPCICFNNYFLGNITKLDFRDIWASTKRHQFIEQQKNYRLNLCKHCIIGVQRNHNFYMSLKRIYFVNIQNWYLRLLGKFT